jgi:ferritin
LIATRQLTIYVKRLYHVDKGAFVWITEGILIELKKKMEHRQLLVDVLAAIPDDLVRAKMFLKLQFLQEAFVLATKIKDESLLRQIGRKAAKAGDAELANKCLTQQSRGPMQ